MDNYPFNLVPKNKFDTLNINKLMELSDTEILPIIPALLEWIQDMNWSVSPYIVKVLAKHQKISDIYIANLLKAE